MRRWRERNWWPLVLLVAVGVLASFTRGMPGGAEILSLLSWLLVVVLVVVLVPTLFHLYAVARDTLGLPYALAHLALAILLLPLGGLLVPKLVESDRASGFADWRRGRPMPPSLLVLRWSLALLGALLGALLAGVAGFLLGILAGIGLAYVASPLL